MSMTIYEILFREAFDDLGRGFFFFVDRNSTVWLVLSKAASSTF